MGQSKKKPRTKKPRKKKPRTKKAGKKGSASKGPMTRKTISRPAPPRWGTSKKKPKKPIQLTPEVILQTFINEGRAFSTSDLARKLGVTKSRDKELRKFIRELIRQDKLVRYRKGQYALPAVPEAITGRIRINPRGFGFIDFPEEEGKDSIFIPKGSVGAARDCDLVEVTCSGPGRSGRVIKVVERGKKRLVGEVVRTEKNWEIHPWDPSLPSLVVASTQGIGLRRGEIVSAEFLEESEDGTPQGRVLRRLGSKGDPRVGVEAIIADRNLPLEFPKEVLEEVERIPAHVRDEDVFGRKDLRSHLTLTIDPVDAKDFDDALSVEVARNGTRILRVSIADVSHYIPEGSALDVEALRRGTSVYFPSRVLPMLPEHLSENICSLRPNEDRLAMTAEIHFDKHGQVRHADFYQSVIRSAARLTYEEAQHIIEQKPDRKDKLNRILHELAGLSQSLTGFRRKRGLIDLNLPEVKIMLDRDGEPARIEKKPRLLSHRIVEECMLAANQAVARHLARRGVEQIQRVHEPPDGKDVEELRAFLAEISLSIGGGEHPQARDYQQLLESVAGSPFEQSVNRAVLLSLRKAFYGSDRGGHYALNVPLYCHFTSPIRRYPDLVTHRILKASFYGQRSIITPERLAEISRHASEREEIAEKAERDSISYYGSRWLSRHLGQEFEGFVSGLIEKGMFVELKHNLVEGFIPFFRTGLTHQSFRLGDPVRVRVVSVELERSRNDFEIVGAGAPLTVPLADHLRAKKAKKK